MRTFILFITLVVSCIPTLTAQPWIRSYNTSWNPPRVEQLGNGDALFHEERGSGIMRTTPSGTIVWHRSYGVAIQKVAEQASGALVALCVVPDEVLSGVSHPAILYLDAQGQPTAPLTVIGVDVQVYHWFDLALAPNGNIIVSTHSNGGNGSVHAFNASGVHLWSRNGNGRTPSRMVCSSDGSIYAVYGPLLMKWSANGDLIWRKTISIPAGSLVLWEILITADIPVVLALYGVPGQPTRPALVMFHSDGAVSNAVTWALPQFEHSLSYTGFAATQDGGIAIAASFTSNTPVVQRGAIITTYVDPLLANTRCEEVDLGYTTLHDVALASNGGLYVVGYSPSNGTPGGTMLMRTDNNWRLGDCASSTSSLNVLLAPTATASTGQLPIALSTVMTTRAVMTTVEAQAVYPVCGAGDRSAVRLRVLLGGAYNGTTGLMRDDLRTNAMVPLTEPYTALGYNHIGVPGGLTTQSRLDVIGSQAVVDWVFVELLDPNGNVASTRTALLRRNGTVTMPHGSATIVFHVPAGTYYVRIRHRNHLKVVSAIPLALGTNPLLDLTTAPTFGTDAQQVLGGVAMLWPGDVIADDMVRYTGQSNDRDLILQAIGGTVPTNSVTMYAGTDVNLDGWIRYTGQDNDRDIILQTIGGVVPTNTRHAQSP
ncbi:MAG: hypothetical protein IPI91_13855 [Flavobacteriales bacterium]|nr:hypothetical protein [Flavobacteriales bacterium]MBK9537085.1 hypothetical protein [Flavobacteriales bacterium]MBP9137987.1 hypothetical protein [Flavobacteriales bacterium]HQX29530.1 hypothetical protein [Flavobacteriales bacterium]HQX38829.1 hypothetical protein [Flavobacteriales bacterium]